MSKITKDRSSGDLIAVLARGTAAAALSAGLGTFAVAGQALAQAAAPAAAQTVAPPVAKTKIPALASIEFAWLARGVHWFDAPASLGHGPIHQDPAFAYHGNLDGPGRVTPDIGNIKDPVLKPWAAAQMQESNDDVLSGKRGLPFVAQSTCHPGGVPGQLLTPAEPLYFIQTPKEVWMVWQRDHMVRRIFLTEQHSENVSPSWFGELIGHYEDGALVVDTIGLSTHNSFLDWYRTPHSEKEHVVERYTISADGKTLEAMVTVDDPDAFNEPLHMIQRWRKVPNPMLETVCAENNGDRFGHNLFPIPQADKPDF